MMSNSEKEQKEAADLKRAIRKITKRTPVSNNVRYLTQRLADLEKRKDAGEDIERHASQHSVLSVSMPVDARAAVDRILERENLGASELVRLAIALWAKSNDYKTEAITIEG